MRIDRKIIQCSKNRQTRFIYQFAELPHDAKNTAPKIPAVNLDDLEDPDNDSKKFRGAFNMPPKEKYLNFRTVENGVKYHYRLTFGDKTVQIEKINVEDQSGTNAKVSYLRLNAKDFPTMPGLGASLEKSKNKIQLDYTIQVQVETTLDRFRKQPIEGDTSAQAKRVQAALQKDLENVLGKLGASSIAGFSREVFVWTKVEVNIDNGKPPKVNADASKINQAWVLKNMVRGKEWNGLVLDSIYRDLRANFKKYKNHEAFARAVDEYVKAAFKGKELGTYDAVIEGKIFTFYNIAPGDQRVTGPYTDLSEKIQKEERQKKEACTDKSCPV